MNFPLLLAYPTGCLLWMSKPAAGTTHLHNLANKFLREGLASSTRSTYAAGEKRFYSFCTATKCHPLPASEATLVLFSTHLAATNTSHSTIKVYLAAVRQLHVLSGLHEFFNRQLTPRLQQVLRGIKKCQAEFRPTKLRLPITTQLMQQIQQMLSKEPHSYTNVMMWAACCIAFFGFMRVSEFTVPNRSSYDKSTDLCLSDIAVDNRENPRLLRVTIKQSKTDPFRKGVSIFLGATGRSVCPVHGILPYLVARGDTPGPLFITEDGNGLTRQTFADLLNSILSKLHLDSKNYNTHSFRIGAATSAAQANIPDASIKMMGRWKSDAYQSYIKTPPKELAKLSRQLVSSL